MDLPMNKKQNNPERDLKRSLLSELEADVMRAAEYVRQAVFENKITENMQTRQPDLQRISGLTDLRLRAAVLEKGFKYTTFFTDEDLKSHGYTLKEDQEPVTMVVLEKVSVNNNDELALIRKKYWNFEQINNANLSHISTSNNLEHSLSAMKRIEDVFDIYSDQLPGLTKVSETFKEETASLSMPKIDIKRSEAIGQLKLGLIDILSVEAKRISTSGEVDQKSLICAYESLTSMLKLDQSIFDIQEEAEKRGMSAYYLKEVSADDFVRSSQTGARIANEVAASYKVASIYSLDHALNLKRNEDKRTIDSEISASLKKIEQNVAGFVKDPRINFNRDTARLESQSEDQKVVRIFDSLEFKISKTASLPITELELMSQWQRNHHQKVSDLLEETYHILEEEVSDAFDIEPHDDPMAAISNDRKQAEFMMSKIQGIDHSAIEKKEIVSRMTDMLTKIENRNSILITNKDSLDVFTRCQTVLDELNERIAG